MASHLRVDKIEPVDGVPTGGGGGIVQVVQSAFTGTSSATGAINTALTDFESVTGLFCTMTPKFSTSKILVQMNLTASLSVTTNVIMFRMRRKIGSGSFSDLDAALGTAASSRYRCTTVSCNVGNAYTVFPTPMNFLDSPATTDAVSYSFSAAHDSGSSRTIYINRGDNDTSSYAYVPRAISTITLMEVSA